MPDLRAPIGVFDSGMGGISVLRELVRCMPNESFIFFGDSLHAPYGIRSADEVRLLTEHAVEHFIDFGVKAVVIACNTATSAAAKLLRAKYPELPIIGLEPALKPAVLANPGGRVLVMATPLTLRERKFADMMDRYREQAEIITQPAPVLVEYVERDLLDSSALHVYLENLLLPYREDRVDAVVLGCTHFPFARKQIADALGYPVEFFDGGNGAARETKRLLQCAGMLTDRTEKARVTFENSQTTEERMQICRKLFEAPYLGQ